jgi:hypothetical protein
LDSAILGQYVDRAQQAALTRQLLKDLIGELPSDDRTASESGDVGGRRSATRKGI